MFCLKFCVQRNCVTGSDSLRDYISTVMGSKAEPCYSAHYNFLSKAAIRECSFFDSDKTRDFVHAYTKQLPPHNPWILYSIEESHKIGEEG